MLFKNHKSPAHRSNRMGLKLAALLFSSLVMMPVTGVSAAEICRCQRSGKHREHR